MAGLIAVRNKNEIIPVAPTPLLGLVVGLSLHNDEGRGNARGVPPRSADCLHVCSILA